MLAKASVMYQPGGKSGAIQPAAGASAIRAAISA
jgi:hypothetical protein